MMNALSIILAAVLTTVSPSQKQVLFLGDSITKGEIGDPDGWGYRKAFQRAAGPGYSYIGKYESHALAGAAGLHSGYNGQKAADILKRIDIELARFKEAGTVILIIGTNDVSHNTPIKEYLSNLAIIEFKIRAKGHKLILGTIPPRLDEKEALTRDFNAEIRKFFPGAVDIHSAMTEECRPLQACFSDPRHPNKLGYEIIGKTLARQL